MIARQKWGFFDGLPRDKEVEVVVPQEDYWREYVEGN